MAHLSSNNPSRLNQYLATSSWLIPRSFRDGTPPTAPPAQKLPVRNTSKLRWLGYLEKCGIGSVHSGPSNTVPIYLLVHSTESIR